MTRDAEGEWDGGIDDCIDGRGDVGGEDLLPAEFFVSPVSGEPHFSQWAFFGQNDLGVKHYGRASVVLFVVLIDTWFFLRKQWQAGRQRVV